MTNVVALCVGICGFLVFTHLLRTGSIGSTAYPALLTLLAVVTIAIARIDLLQILDLKNMRVEMQKAREEVFAKVEELQRIAAGVASFTAAGIIAESRFTGLDHQDRMLRRRDELARFLQDAGVPEPRREELIRPITTMVDWDLRRAIVINAVAAWKAPPGTSPTDATERDRMQKDLEAILQRGDRPAALTEASDFLEKRKVSSESLTRSTDEYRQMLASGRLPRFGPVDDLRTAPIR
jgi:hypothetical protein